MAGRGTNSKAVGGFEVHYSDAIWVVRAIRADHTNPVR
jgi:hypothetical protein